MDNSLKHIAKNKTKLIEKLKISYLVSFQIQRETYQFQSYILKYINNLEPDVTNLDIISSKID